ncbi:MAG: hypothetical protein CVT49_15435 [candidate division Zixibacteria bacterium HGW-Zixibacteria-1]|nr:MAG: hypothetical protein CVT49_15435 [candidate division Zixibacteria bacterium HGW-Zixibacteria-1]
MLKHILNWINGKKAIIRLRKLIESAKALEDVTHEEDGKFIAWKTIVSDTLSYIYGSSSNQRKNFEDIKFGFVQLPVTEEWINMFSTSMAKSLEYIEGLICQVKMHGVINKKEVILGNGGENDGSSTGFLRKQFIIGAILFLALTASSLVVYIIIHKANQNEGSEYFYAGCNEDSGLNVVISEFDSPNKDIDNIFKIGELVGNVEQILQKFSYPFKINVFYVPRVFHSKAEMMNLYKNQNCNLLIYWGVIKNYNDSLILKLNSNLIQDKSLQWKAETATFVVDYRNSVNYEKKVHEISLFIVRQVNVILALQDEIWRDRSQKINTIEDILNKYKQNRQLNAGNIDFSFLYSLLANEELNIHDSVAFINHARMAYQYDTTFYFSNILYGRALGLDGQNSEDFHRAVSHIEYGILNAYNKEQFYQLYAGSLTMLGEALNAESKRDSAIYYWMKAIRIDPQFPISYLSLGQSFLSECNLKEANYYINTAFILDSTDNLCQYQWGIIKTLNGDFLMARQLFRKSFEKDPKAFLMSRLAWVDPINKCDYDYYDSLISYTSNIELIM